MANKSSSSTKYLDKAFENSVITKTSWAGTSASYATIGCLIQKQHRQYVGQTSPTVDGVIQYKTLPYSSKRIFMQSEPQGFHSYRNAYGCFKNFPKSIFYKQWITNWKNFGNMTYLPKNPVSNAEYAATNAFYNEVAAAKINLGLAFAERQKTVDLVTGTAKKIARAILLLKKGKFKRAAAALGIENPKKSKYTNVSDQWLELQYGWKPLLSDVRGAMIATVPRPVTVSIRVSRESWEEHSRTYATQFNECNVKRLYTIKTFADVSGPAIAQASELGLLNPAILAWELVPFSFVVDWFIPIGAWLGAQSALLGITLRDTSITKTDRFYTHMRGSNEEILRCSYKRSYAPAGKNIAFTKTKVRVVGVTPPLYPPRWKNPLSVTHALNALALLTSITQHGQIRKIRNDKRRLEQIRKAIRHQTNVTRQ